ncbi:UDP-N-acetylglucosamine 2-epimerase [Novosphingobium sp. Gsoil 351]|uniref:UDP-N-acetylglucosamine 2-epimerase n=1 Tax=Novosphingobium sp. Gsoil 351 TaxID=2675225 RepID=UPI002102439A|nr:UDP-N-acetylglucosamine 2-epimerase [Novosphingobium sp. Gsoil 351]
MAARKILTVFGTRPEAIKLFPLLHALTDDPRFISFACVSAQHRAMLDQVLDIAGSCPCTISTCCAPIRRSTCSTATLLTGLGRVMDAENPDWVVIQGDVATAMACALSAFSRKISVAHVEARLRSGPIHPPWPDEVTRKISARLLSCTGPDQDRRGRA